MKKIFAFFIFYNFLIPVYSAVVSSAANLEYVKQAMQSRGCILTNNATNGAGANMEYLLKTIDICNSGTTDYGISGFATLQWASTAAVDWCANFLYYVRPPYVTNGMMVFLDAKNYASFVSFVWKDMSGYGNDVTLFKSPIISNDGIQFNGIDQYARTTNKLNFNGLDAITIEIRFKNLSAEAYGLLFEHSENWNENTGGFGAALNEESYSYLANTVHTNWKGISTSFPNNYSVNLNDLESHTMTNTYSSVPNPTGRLFYYDGKLIDSSGLYNNGTGIYQPLVEHYMYFATRLNKNVFTGPLIIQSVRIYGRQLSSNEVCVNAWADYEHFGGTVPECLK